MYTVNITVNHSASVNLSAADMAGILCQYELAHNYPLMLDHPPDGWPQNIFYELNKANMKLNEENKFNIKIY